MVVGWLWRGAAALGFILGLGAAALSGRDGVAWSADGPPSKAGSYAVFGLDSVTLRAKVTVEGGDVGVNAPAGILTLMRRAQVDGAAAATTVRVGQQAGAEALFCVGHEPVGPTEPSGTTAGAMDADATGVVCGPMTHPVLGAASFPVVQAHPGTERLRVEPAAFLGPLDPGAYGPVRVGDMARLELAGGEYDFRSLWVGYRSQLTCRQACTIRVARYATIRERAVLGAETPTDAGSMRLEIAGGRGSSAAFRVYRRATVNAVVYAPNGGVVLGMNGRYNGSFTGKDVLIYQHSQVIGLSGLAVPDPSLAPPDRRSALSTGRPTRRRSLRKGHVVHPRRRRGTRGACKTRSMASWPSWTSKSSR